MLWFPDINSLLGDPTCQFVISLPLSPLRLLDKVEKILKVATNTIASTYLRQRLIPNQNNEIWLY
jgi:hypothetical protein